MLQTNEDGMDEDKMVIEIPNDLVEQFDQIWRDDFGSDIEIQAYLVGRKSTVGEKRIVTVYEMIIPAQKGTYTGSKLLDNDFLRKVVQGGELVGMIHVHCDHSGVYLSGADIHTAAVFQHVYCKNSGFFSAVLCPKTQSVGFMVVKSDKLESAVKCAQLSGLGKPTDHDHPDCWATVECHEMNYRTIITDVRSTNEKKLISDLGDPFEPTEMIRRLTSTTYTPMTDREVLDFHNIGDNETDIDMLRKSGRKESSVGRIFTIRPRGMKHDDEGYLSLAEPIEEMMKDKSIRNTEDSQCNK